jgi:hypothetical protein
VKNYVQLFLGVETDTGVLTQYTWGASFEECQQLMAGFTKDISGPMMFYILLNKNNLANMVRGNTALFAPMNDGSMPTNDGLYTQDPSSLDDWNVDNANFTTDPNDKASVEARDIAEKVLGGGTTKGTTLTLTVVQMLAFTYLALKASRLFALATRVLFILTQLGSGLITDAEALAAYEKIVAANPKVFI